MAKLLVIDNYDSFTYNLVQMFRRYPLDIMVSRSDRISLDDVEKYAPDYILISPGPKDPAHAGISVSLIRSWYKKVPILGVCLGMQCINEAFGGVTVRAPVPMHGKTSMVSHEQTGIFKNIDTPFCAARYHSLVVEPADKNGASVLCVTARSDDRTIMGLSHKNFPLSGVQFHPESFLTEHGFLMIENFLCQGSLKETIQ